jgi:hypothetical protein
MVLASGLDAAGVLIVFGFMQLGTAVVYRMPMPVQPLKAVAAIVIAGQIPAAVVHGGGLAIGVVMLLLSVTGLVGWLARAIPKAVVRGVQAGSASSSRRSRSATTCPPEARRATCWPRRLSRSRSRCSATAASRPRRWWSRSACSTPS